MDMNLSKLWKRVKDREAWSAVVYGTAKSRTQLSDSTTATCIHVLICQLEGFRIGLIKLSLHFMYILRLIHFSSVQSLSPVRLFATPRIAARQGSISTPTPGVYPNSCPLSQWCHSAISASVVPFSSCPQSLPASGSFPMSQCFTWGGQSIGVSASASVLPMNIQDWSPLGWTGWISLQSKGLSRVFSNTPVQKHQFFSAQLSSRSKSHIHTWPLEKP